MRFRARLDEIRFDLGYRLGTWLEHTSDRLRAAGHVRLGRWCDELSVQIGGRALPEDWYDDIEELTDEEVAASKAARDAEMQRLVASLRGEG